MVLNSTRRTDRVGGVEAAAAAFQTTTAYTQHSVLTEFQHESAATQQLTIAVKYTQFFL